METTYKGCQILGPASPTECLSRLFHTKAMTDLTITFPDYPQVYEVHRLVLAMWSDVWSAMLFGPLAESDTIVLEGDDPEIMGWLMHYMYTGEAKLNNVQLTVQLYLTANKYNMTHLETLCSKSLLSSVTAADVAEVLNIASLLQDYQLFERCAEVLLPSSDDLFRSPSFSNLTKDNVEWVLDTQLSVSSEVVILQALRSWGHNQLESKGKDLTFENLRNEMHTFMHNIRFQTLTLKELDLYVVQADVLTQEELDSIREFLANETKTCSLPLIGSRERDKRTKPIHTCELQPGKIIYSNPGKWYEAGEEVTILTDVSPVKSVYLSYFSYDLLITSRGLKLCVKDNRGNTLQSIDFIDGIARFKSLKLSPDNIYSFVIINEEKMYLNPILAKNCTPSVPMGKCCMVYRGIIHIDYFDYWE